MLLLGAAGLSLSKALVANEIFALVSKDKSLNHAKAKVTLNNPKDGLVIEVKAHLLGPVYEDLIAKKNTFVASEGIKLPEGGDSDDFITTFFEINIAMGCGQEKTQAYWDFFYEKYQKMLEPMLQEVAPAFKLKGTASAEGLKI